MPRRSRHLAGDINAARAELQAKGVNPDKVSMACVIGDHAECQNFGGKIMLKRVTPTGRRYERCQCPDCQHPEPRTRNLTARTPKHRRR